MSPMNEGLLITSNAKLSLGVLLKFLSTLCILKELKNVISPILFSYFTGDECESCWKLVPMKVGPSMKILIHKIIQFHMPDFYE